MWGMLREHLPRAIVEAIRKALAEKPVSSDMLAVFDKTFGTESFVGWHVADIAQLW
jgi:hypothetical protein